MLTLSVKGKYALSAMLTLTEKGQNNPVSIQTIAEENNIPQNYLEQLLSDLRKEGLVTSFRGAHGGYILAKPPAEITVLDILVTLEGPSKLKSGHKGCTRMDFFWSEIDVRIQDLFKVSLQELKFELQKRSNAMTFSI